jgi:hypothetical protein
MDLGYFLHTRFTRIPQCDGTQLRIFCCFAAVVQDTSVAEIETSTQAFIITTSKIPESVTDDNSLVSSTQATSTEGNTLSALILPATKKESTETECVLLFHSAIPLQRLTITKIPELGWL